MKPWQKKQKFIFIFIFFLILNYSKSAISCPTNCYNNGNDEFLITIDTGNHRYTNTDIWNDNHNRFENFNVIGETPYGIFAGDGIVAWANFPEHYKGE